MGLSKEVLMPETGMFFPPVIPSSSERKVNIFPIKEGGVRARIRELSRMLSAESKKGEEEDQPQKETRTDGFEPSVNPESPNDPLFINGYAGNFAQRMELNRRRIERVLQIVHLDGKVALISMPSSRTRSIDANPDGTVTGKGNLTIEEKINDDEENSLKRVISTPEGWRIEINDTRITEDLVKKNLTGQKLQTEFIHQFNRQLKLGLLESIWREKFSSEKDRYFKRKAFDSILFNPSLTLAYLAWTRPELGLSGTISHLTTAFLLLNFIGNFFSVLHMKDMKRFDNHARIFNPKNNVPSSAHIVRKFDSLWEYFMPAVEIDKVLRSAAFLAVKGRNLVKEIS